MQMLFLLLRCCFVQGVLFALFVFLSGCTERPVPASDDRSQVKTQAAVEKTKPVLKRQLLWGDIQVYSENSFGAALLGNQLTPAQVYRYAKGQPVNYHGTEILLQTALDFLVLADSSDNYGFISHIKRGDDTHSLARRWQAMMANGQGRDVAVDILARIRKGNFPDALKVLPGSEAYSKSWLAGLRAAEDANEPGVFTAMIAYEWSAQLQDQDMAARVLVYRGNADSAAQIMPYTTQSPEGSIDVLSLWEWMSYFERQTHTKLLTILHHRQAKNTPLETASIPGQAQLQDRFEPLLELVPAVLSAQNMTAGRGFVGGSGALTGLASGTQAEFLGQYPSWSAEQPRAIDTSQSSGGLTGVWAGDNTRAEIFDALARRETFVTTGSRPVLRVFAAWDFDEADLANEDLSLPGYQKGVPMGGRLTIPRTDTPAFLIEARRDPNSNGLDQLQMLKVTVDEHGERHLKTYVLDWAERPLRTKNTSGDVDALAPDIDDDFTTFNAAQGSSSFKRLWRDPEFDVTKEASYVVKLVEAPVPRWPSYHIDKLSKQSLSESELIMRHEAYSSPIRYVPQ